MLRWQGTCVFVEDEQTKKQKAKCRFDFYQVGSNISMSVYAKKTDPSGCFFRASSHKLLLEIAYDAGMKTYAMDVTLAGPIACVAATIPCAHSQALVPGFNACATMRACGFCGHSSW